jgi:hypothetical protein
VSVSNIVMGSFVSNDKHPEHGLGRVLAIGAFATRVLFERGGVRVFRAGEPNQLKVVLKPDPAAADVLAAKEAAMAQGVTEAPLGPVKPPPAPPKANKRKK